MSPSRQDQIWNRACLEAGGPSPGEGDAALAAMLLAHGLVMNGGVVHAVESLAPDELGDAISGFGYFGLSAVANLLSQAHDHSEEAEDRLNSEYWGIVPDDSTLEQAFRDKLLQSPEAFAPVASGSHA